jgi:hypothetical protein
MAQITTSEIEWVLSLPKEAKLLFIDQALKDGDFSMALSIAKIFLDAPITKGGISTEEIDDVFKKNGIGDSKMGG